MRLKTRLERLESASGDSLGLSEKMMLIAILGRRDAMFWPWRWQTGRKAPICEIRRRQREYLAGQVGIAAKADGREQWKDAHETRQTLIAGGYLTAVHSSGQVQSCFITPLGESYARALVGDRLHCYHESGVLLLGRLRQLSVMTPVRAVRESILFCHPCIGDPTEWNTLTELIFPCVTAGIVKVDTDTQGRIAYAPVEGVPEPPQVTVEATANDAFDAHYVNTFDDERQVLESCEPRDPSEIFIPLPATGWGYQCHFEEASKKLNGQEKQT